jgi:hypothetical protein
MRPLKGKYRIVKHKEVIATKPEVRKPIIKEVDGRVVAII